MRYLVLTLIAGLFLAGCKGTGPGKTIEEAKNLLAQGKVDTAVVLFQKVINDYGTDTATVTAYYELARIYQSHLSEKVSVEESKTKAVEMFLAVNEKFPNSKEAPTSLFMAAFIQANDMKQFDKATKNYKQFVEKYPKHELAASAQDELNNMGKAPEIVLDEKTKPQVAGK